MLASHAKYKHINANGFIYNPTYSLLEGGGGGEFEAIKHSLFTPLEELTFIV